MQEIRLINGIPYQKGADGIIRRVDSPALAGVPALPTAVALPVNPITAAKDARREQREDQRDARTQGNADRADRNERRRIELDEDAATNKSRDDENALRSAFEAQPAVKAYRDAATSLGVMLQTPDNGGGDIQVIYNYIKSQGPGPVAQGELDLANSVASFTEGLEQKYGKITSSNRLPPRVRMELIEAARQAVSAKKAQFDPVYSQFRADATRDGLSPESVTGRHPADAVRPVEEKYIRAQGGTPRSVSGIPVDPKASEGDKSVASGPTRRVYDERLESKIDSLISAGKFETANIALRKAGKAPISPAERTSIQQWQAKNPGVAYNASQFGREVPTSLLQRVAGSDAGAGLARGANAATGGLVGLAAGSKGQGALDAMAANSPKSALAGDIFGGVLGAFGAEAGAAAALGGRGAAWLAPRLGDAAYGASTGFNAATEGEGGMGALKGAGAGVFGGFLGDKFGRFIWGGQRALREGGNGYLSGADKSIFRTLEPDMPQIRTDLADAQRLNVPYSLADASNKGRILAGSVSRKSVNARDLAERTFDPRGLAQADRARDAIDTHLAPVTDIAERNAMHLENARTNSNPLYATAKANPAPDLAANPALADLLRRPSAESGLRGAYDSALDRGVSPADLSVRTDLNGDIAMDADPTWQTIHTVRQGIDAKINGTIDPVTRNVKPGMEQAKRDMETLRRDIDAQIGILNPEFKLADAAYAEQAQLGEALNRGFSTAPKNLPSRDVGRIVDDLPAPQLPEFQRGYATNMADQVNRTRMVSDPYKTVYGSPNQMANVRTVFPQGAGRFDRIADLEANMARTRYETTGGSPTAARLQADQQLNGGLASAAVDVGSMAMGAPPMATGARLLQGAADNWRLGLGVQRADAIAPNLFNTAPALATQYLDELLARQAIRDGKLGTAGRYGGILGAAVATPFAIGQ